MYSNLGKGIVLLWLFLLSFPCSAAELTQNQGSNMPLAVALTKVTEASIQQVEPAQVSFVAQPEQCVSLRQGRNCFATIKLEWQADTKQSLCLYQYGHKKEIACWQDDKVAQFEFEFESDQTVIYQLRSLKNEQVIAQTQVKVSWLHKKSSRKKRWRLF